MRAHAGARARPCAAQNWRQGAGERARACAERSDGCGGGSRVRGAPWEIRARPVAAVTGTGTGTGAGAVAGAGNGGGRRRSPFDVLAHLAADGAGDLVHGPRDHQAGTRTAVHDQPVDLLLREEVVPLDRPPLLRSDGSNRLAL